MKIFTFIFSLTFMVFVANAQTGLYVPELEAVEQSLQDFMNQWDIPGASLAIAKDGKLVYARGLGFADLDTEEPVQPDSRFRLASISKPLTSAAIFHLIEAGQLTLDDQVFGEEGILNDPYYLPLQDERMENITIRHLLAHTGGWEGSGQSGIDPMFSSLLITDAMEVPPPAMQEDIVAYMATKKNLDFTPGTKVTYANFGYSILGRVIETIGGQSYEGYLQDQIFAALGATSFSLAKNLLSDRQEKEVRYYDNVSSPLYLSTYGTGELVPEQYGGMNVEAMDAHGGWIGTPTDLLLFALAVDGLSTRPDILGNSTIQTMRLPGITGSGFGHGWGLYNGGVYHFGLLPGSAGELDINLNNGIAFAVVLNRQSYSSQFLNSLDAAIWGGLAQVASFPDHDLFEENPLADKHIENNFQINISPNPSDGIFKIELPKGTERYSIFDLRGKKIDGGQTSIDKAALELDLSNYNPGTYFIKLENEKSIYFGKLIKI